MRRFVRIHRFAPPAPRLLAPLLFGTLLLAGLFAYGALAQDGEQSSGFVGYVERLLSTPDRRVSLHGVEDLFSWHPKAERIEVADRNGVWLELEGVEVAWTRAALLRRMLDIQVLRASRVVVRRRPVAEEAAEPGTIAPPPVEIVINSLSLPQVVLGQEVAGAEAELAVAGGVRLTQEALSAQLAVDRQDRAGTLLADIRFDRLGETLAAELKLEEPAGGILSEVLQLRGRPALSIALSGSGPLDGWAASLEIQADRTRVASGAMSVARLDAGHRLRARLAASLETLVPQDYAALVAGESGIDLDLTRFNDGRIEITAGSLGSEGLDLSASGLLGPDMVPERADVSLSLGQAGRAALPFLPGGVSFAELRATASLGAGDTAPWQIEVAAEGAEGEFGDVARLRIEASGEAERLTDADARSTSLRIEGSAEGIALANPALNEAVGPTLSLDGSGRWSAGEPVTFDSLRATLAGFASSFSGTADAAELSGVFDVSIASLSRFARLLDRPAIAGELNVKASGVVATDGDFSLTLEGGTGGLELGMAMLDPLLQGDTRIEGTVARRDGGLSFNGLKAANDQVSGEVDGSLAGAALDLVARGDIADLALVTQRATGAAHVDARVRGTREAPSIEAEISGDSVVLMGRPLADATARFSGIVAGPATSGEAEIAGTLGGAPVLGSARLAAGDDGSRQIEGLSFSVGESRVSGNLAVRADGLLAGDVRVVSPDLSKVAPLFLAEASGMLRGEISLSAEDGVQSASFSATATDIVYENVTLESADLRGQASDLFKAPQMEGSFSLRNMNAGGMAIVTATGTAARLADSTAVSVDATLADGSAQLQAVLAPAGNGLAIGLQSFSYARPGIDLALVRPTTISVADGGASIEPTELSAGGGQVILSGRAGAQLDLSATLNAVPAALANAFSPSLGAEGPVSGTVTARGPAASPDARFSLTLANTSVAATRNAGLGPLAVSAEGGLARDVLTLQSGISGAGGLAIDVAGTIGTSAGGPLDLRVTGSAPLALGNAQLASRGAALDGTLDIDVSIAGTASNPQYSGRITSGNGAFVDPATGIVLRNLQLAAAVSGQRVIVERLSAASGEGTVTGSGSIGLDPNAGFPVDLTVSIKQVRYVDGTLVASRFDADLKLSGTFAAGPLLEGAVFLDRTEITVPERLPRDSVAVDVKHVAPPPPVEQTLTAARQPDSRDARADGSPQAGIRLDIAIRAPQQIFVRGRGLDAEFGGDLRVTGTTSALTAAGAFTMNRGRLDILTRRITFDRGIITFSGDLDPQLDFSGTTRSGDVSITATVSGRASDPQVTFTSTPDLPQDEILARLIFQKGIGELSPLQVARLAAAASELTGGSGGLLSSLRRSTGLDDLDIVTDDEGQTAVAAGRYVTENVYLGVQQGTSAESSRVTIDLDVTKNVKARAGMSAEGKSSLGIFFEKEY